MADEFGQFVKGLFLDGDSVVDADHSHQAIVAERSSDNTYRLLQIGDNDGLKVDIVDASGITIDVDVAQFAVGSVAGATDLGTTALVVRDDALTTLSDADGDYVRMRVDSTGALWVVQSADVTVTATDLDIRNFLDQER